MNLWDKMFKKNKFDEAMENAFQNIIENNPIMRDTKSKINEAADSITSSLHEELGESGELPPDRPSILENSEAVTSDWDRMFDQLVDRELGRIKVCPKCGAKNKALNFYCSNCGKKLELVPEQK